MLKTLPPEFEKQLSLWVKSSLANGHNILAGGYQATILFYDDGVTRLAIKVPPSRWWKRLLLLPLLRHECKVYQKLGTMEGIPRCYGLLNNRFLVLEHIAGVSLRDGQVLNREKFFVQLLELIRRIHAADVGHMDLKKKDNILIAEDQCPYLVDFGVACIRKPGFAPFNHWLFDVALSFDLNAWIKHKYERRYGDISAEDIVYFRPMLIERVARSVKKLYRRMRRKLRRWFLR